MSIVERSIEKVRRATGAIGSLGLGAGRNDEAVPETFVAPSRRILVDRIALRDAGYMPEATEDRAFADQYRQIKRPVIAAALASSQVGAGSPGLIMMASALPGDGKTFTGINLALSMARERDTSVVLVDADIPKPHVSRIFGVENEQGLTDALADDRIDIESLILPTDVRGLSILPAGGRRDGAAELLASARMKQIVRQMQERFPRRLALFDSSPLLVSSESQALATSVGHVLLVVRARTTPRQAVLDAIELLGQGMQVSMVLNQGRPSITQGYYGSGAYGSYGDE